MAENSPTFQRWVREVRGAQVPKGRLKPRAIRQPSLRDLSDCGREFPTLKRWAIIACPSGTKTRPGFAGILWEQILVALDKNVRRGVMVGFDQRARVDNNVRAPITSEKCEMGAFAGSHIHAIAGGLKSCQSLRATDHGH